MLRGGSEVGGLGGLDGKEKGSRTHQVCEAVQLLAHQAALAAPPRHLAVHEVEEQPERHEGEGRPRVGERGRRAEAVAQRAEDGHEAAEACKLGLERRECGAEGGSGVAHR